MLVPDLTNPLFPPIVRGIEDRLRDSGFIMVLANTDNDADKERSLVAAMTARRVDGLILATARREYPLLRRVTGAGIPTVLVNRTTDAATVPAVLSDDHSGIGQAVRHLAGLGHTRIAHVGGTREVSTGVARYQSFVSWMREVGLDPDPERIVFARWFREDLGAEAFRELFARGGAFTAVVCANDLIALGGYTVLRERGLRCPEDISIVGYNDTPLNDKFSPPLTSVRIPHYRIGYRAADLLLELVDDAEATPVDARLQPALVVRGATAPPPGCRPGARAPRRRGGHAGGRAAQAGAGGAGLHRATAGLPVRPQTGSPDAQGAGHQRHRRGDEQRRPDADRLAHGPSDQAGHGE